MKTFIIAEAGVNHNGSIDLAKELIDIAVKSGVDAVKFQTFKAELIVSKSADKAEYQKSTTDINETQYEMLKSLELTEQMHETLVNYCKLKNIDFLSTPFDFPSIYMLNKLGMTKYKIPSGEITNLPYLRAVAGVAKEIILSTGMSSLAEVKQAFEVLLNAGMERKNITVLHATSEYPCPMREVNLNAMLTLKNELNVNTGYSDHTNGIEVPIAAVAMGATVIEKHFTISRDLPGPDHAASLEPDELIAMVKGIRNIELALGSGEKKATTSELLNLKVGRKSIVAKTKIKKGDLLTEDNVTVKRPGYGLNPMKYWDVVIGSSATKDYTTEDLIEWEG